MTKLNNMPINEQHTYRWLKITDSTFGVARFEWVCKDLRPVELMIYETFYKENKDLCRS